MRRYPDTTLGAIQFLRSVLWWLKASRRVNDTIFDDVARYEADSYIRSCLEMVTDQSRRESDYIRAQNARKP